MVAVRGAITGGMAGGGSRAAGALANIAPIFTGGVGIPGIGPSGTAPTFPTGGGGGISSQVANGFPNRLGFRQQGVKHVPGLGFERVKYFTVMVLDDLRLPDSRILLLWQQSVQI